MPRLSLTKIALFSLAAILAVAAIAALLLRSSSPQTASTTLPAQVAATSPTGESAAASPTAKVIAASPTAEAVAESPTAETVAAFPTAEAAAASPAAGEARPEPLVDTAWVRANLGKSGVRFIDVSGSRSVYDQGHLPGAVYVSVISDLSNPNDPLGAEILTGEALSELFGNLGIENSDTLVLYDDSSNLDAARAYWAIKYYRHPDVRIYDGGSKKWLGEGGTLTTEAVSVEPGNYEAEPPDPALRTSWEYVVEHLGKPGTLMCDTRSAGEYTGEVARAERGGHIPGAINLEWTQSVNEDGTFRSREVLDKLYREAGFVPEKDIITYCQIGVRAAHTWFVLHELLGFPNVRVYDGSWEEYGNRSESPIEQ